MLAMNPLQTHIADTSDIQRSNAVKLTLSSEFLHSANNSCTRQLAEDLYPVRRPAGLMSTTTRATSHRFEDINVRTNPPRITAHTPRLHMSSTTMEYRTTSISELNESSLWPMLYQERSTLQGTVQSRERCDMTKSSSLGIRDSIIS